MDNLRNLAQLTSVYTASKLIAHIDDIKIMQGRTLALLNKDKILPNLSDYEFKVFSQWGEDGIIQRLTNLVEIKNKTFIEFGVEDFTESNCRFLLMKDDWKGFVIDGSDSNINKIKSSYYYWRHDLNAFKSFVTRENINDILARSEFDSDLGLLSIDIDGVDYFVLEAIDYYKPRILVLEYNPFFGPHRKITVPYRPDFVRTKAHYSNIYFGASLSAMTSLAQKKGYALVCTGTTGANAFFVRNDLLSDQLKAKSATELYPSFNCRESRDEQGNLTCLPFSKAMSLIKGLPVFNVETSALEFF